MTKVLLFQSGSVADERRNGATAAAAIAAAPEADVAVFPELFLNGYAAGLRGGVPAAQAVGMEAIATACLQSSTVAVVGHAGDHGGQVTSAVTVIDQRGAVAGEVHKAVPFAAERDHIVGGPLAGVIAVGDLMLGILICFDMEFPELARRLALEGINLLISVAANPDPYFENHRLHARARALENQVPHVYVNMAGEDGELRFAGGSCLVDASGEVCAELGRRVDEHLVARLPPTPAEQDELGYVESSREIWRRILSSSKRGDAE